MKSEKATFNGENVVVLKWSVVSAGRDDIHEFNIRGKYQFSIGMRMDVGFKDKKLIGKISAVVPGSDRTTLRIAIPRKAR